MELGKKKEEAKVEPKLTHYATGLHKNKKTNQWEVSIFKYEPESSSVKLQSVVECYSLDAAMEQYRITTANTVFTDNVS